MRKRGKKGQVTLFIIIAIVVVSIALLVIFLWPQISGLFMSKEAAEQYLATQAIQLQKTISECIEKESLRAFDIIGKQAGYYDKTGLRTLYFAGNDYVVVMFKNEAKQRINKLPSLGQIENEYQLFLVKEGNEAIDKCINLAAFKRNMNVDAGERKINAMIYPDVIILNVDWPIKLSKTTTQGTVEKLINQQQIMLLLPFGNLWRTANTIVDCETRVDCNFEGIEWDRDIWNNPFRSQYISKEARSLNKDQIVFILESSPYRPGELPHKFNFAIDRS